jgi:hypothetical protein
MRISARIHAVNPLFIRESYQQSKSFSCQNKAEVVSPDMETNRPNPQNESGLPHYLKYHGWFAPF